MPSEAALLRRTHQSQRYGWSATQPRSAESGHCPTQTDALRFQTNVVMRDCVIQNCRFPLAATDPYGLQGIVQLERVTVARNQEGLSCVSEALAHVDHLAFYAIGLQWLPDLDTSAGSILSRRSLECSSHLAQTS